MTFNEFIAELVNHLWQSTAVVALAWFLALALRQNQARVRYWIWCATSAKFLLPFSLLTSVGEWLRSLIRVPAATSAVTNVVEQMTQPFVVIQDMSAAAPVEAHDIHWWIWILLAAWGCGALLVATRFGLAWWKMYGAKHASRRIEIASDVPVLLSSNLIEPGVFGIMRPVLLLPEGILERLSAEQMSTIIAHEMAHMRRRDNLTYAIHMLVEILFWFHPAVWWIGARLIDERERACDEAVVQGGGAAEIYAESILNVCKLYVESPVACAAGVTGADLKQRIIRIMSGWFGVQLGTPKTLVLTCVALVLLLAPFGLGLLYAMQAQLYHPDDHALPSFEVATIKPSDDPSQNLQIIFPPAHFSTKHSSLEDLLKFAYDVKSEDQLVNGPHWLKEQFFDVQAKGEESEIQTFDGLTRRNDFEASLNLSRSLVQTLLRDRFQLKVHFELRDLPVYALTVAKGGPKIREAQLDPLPSAGTKPKPDGHYLGVHLSGPNQHTGTLKMSMLANFLSNSDEIGNRVIVDRTNLTGYYDFVLSGVAMGPQRPTQNGSAPPGEGTISIFTAVHDQLGLELVPQKAPVEVLVIDHVEQPSPN